MPVTATGRGAAHTTSPTPWLFFSRFMVLIDLIYKKVHLRPRAGERGKNAPCLCFFVRDNRYMNIEKSFHASRTLHRSRPSLGDLSFEVYPGARGFRDVGCRVLEVVYAANLFSVFSV